MGRRARTALSRLTPLWWAASAVLAVGQMAGIRDGGALALAAAAAIAGTLAGAVRETDLELKARLIRLLADATDPRQALLQPEVRSAT